VRQTPHAPRPLRSRRRREKWISRFAVAGPWEHSLAEQFRTRQCAIGAEKGPGKRANGPLRRSGGWGVVGRQLSAEPGPGIDPAALDRPRGHALHLSNFLDGHSGKDAQLDQLGCCGISQGELCQSFVQVKQLVIEGDFDVIAIAELATLVPATPTL